MDSAKFNDWMHVVGIFAVVASLIFVGLQMKQTHEIAIAAQYQERAATAIEVIAARSQIDYVVNQIGASLAEDFAPHVSGEMSAADIGAWWFAERLSLVAYDNNHYQWETGFLSDESWDAYAVGLNSILEGPMTKFIIEKRRGHYRESFRRLCLELISDSDSE
jgi:hypothetical protein